MTSSNRHLAIAAACGATIAASGVLAARGLKKLDLHFVTNPSSGKPAAIFNIKGEDGYPVRVMRSGGVFQSATYLDERRYQPVFEYYRAFDLLFSTEKPIHDILMLGGGGYAFPKHVISTRDDVTIDVVEVSQAVTDAALQYFFVDQLIREFDAADRLNLITEEGRAFLSLRAALPQPPKLYDAVVNDTFIGCDPVLPLLTVEAATEVRQNLAQDGLYLINVVSEDFGCDISLLRSVVTTLLVVFKNVHITPCMDECYGSEDNYLVIATDGDYLFEDAITYDADFLTDAITDAELQAE